MNSKINRNSKNGRYILKESDKKIYSYKFNKEDKIYNFIIDSKPNEYFKGNGKHTFDVPELFASELGSFAGLKIVKQYPATYIDKEGNIYDGVISKDYVENREKTEVINSQIPLYEYFGNVTLLKLNAIEYYYKSAKQYIEERNKKINKSKKQIKLDENFVKDLQKLRLFGFICGAEDLWAQNIDFYIENNVLKLAPALDFSYSFLLKSFSSNLRQNFNNNISKQEKLKLVEKELDNIKMSLKVFEENALNNDRLLAAVETAQVLLMDEELMSFYLKLKKIDVLSFLTNFKENNNYKFISENDLELASLVFKTSIKQIEVSLENEKINQSSPLYKISKQADKFNNREFLNYNKQTEELQK